VETPTVPVEARLQLPPGENVPVEFVTKLTVPVGLVGPEDVSVTVAVQLVAVPVVRELGEHAILEVVLCNGAGCDARRKIAWLDV
jgi:hypothetical protein